jgi:cytoskeletal protein RodZ
MHKVEALSILEIPTDGSNTYDSAYITKAYRIASLKYHPDKNENSPESTAKFQQINEAYQYLMSKSNTNTTTTTTTTTTELPSPSSYHDIFVFFIRAMFNRSGIQPVNVNSDDIEAALMHIISSNYDKLLHTLDKSTAVAVYEFMREYADILHLPSDALEKMFKIVSDKIMQSPVMVKYKEEDSDNIDYNDIEEMQLEFMKYMQKHTLISRPK